MRLQGYEKILITVCRLFVKGRGDKALYCEMLNAVPLKARFASEEPFGIVMFKMRFSKTYTVTAFLS